MQILHDSQKLQYRNPFGAVECSTQIELRLDVCAKPFPLGVYALIEIEGKDNLRIEMEYDTSNENRIYKCNFAAPETPCLMWYYFEIIMENCILYYGNNERGMGGPGILSEDYPSKYQITVYSQDYKTPDWFKNSIVYQIFVDRFYNGNDNNQVLNPRPECFIYSSWDDCPMYIKRGNEIARWEFFGGNLLGIIKKLDYLKELGISAIYLNPVFESRSNHKYDTGNYLKIDPMFGNNDTFKELCKKADEKGIRIILDGVFSHTGADSIYFNRFGTYDSIGAYQSKDSEYFSWYKFMQYPDIYESWWGITDLPNVNELDHKYLDFIIYNKNSVLNHWGDLGCKGWRLDVADELPDEFISRFRKTLKDRDSESVIIGEVWEDASNKISYDARKEYFTKGILDSVTNYPLRNGIIEYVKGIITAEGFNKIIMNLFENYPKESFYSVLNLIGGHDVPRILNILSDSLADKISELTEDLYSLSLKRLKLAVLMQLTLPGVPCVYYGDEAGVMGHTEPKNRGTFPWGKINKEISQWYKNLIELRNNNPVLRTGRWKAYNMKENGYVYVRYAKNGLDAFNNSIDNHYFIVFINSSAYNNITLDIDIPINEDKKLISTQLLDVVENKVVKINRKKFSVELKPMEGKIYLGHGNAFPIN